MNPQVEQAVAEALPHTRTCNATRYGAAARCTCGANSRRNVLLAKLSGATTNGRVYLRG